MLRILPRIVLIAGLCVLALPLAALAQQGEEACPAFVFEALEVSAAACDGTARNEACYGHDDVSAEPVPDAATFTFAAAGDIVPLTDLRRLQLEGMDLADQTWGVALLRLQADLPDTLPGQNVTLVLFGDVVLDNAPLAADAGGESFGPMQAFYFATGLGDPPCAEAPVSGLLIQTPEEAEQAITLTINEATVTLGSTAFLQAEAGGDMVVSLLDGAGQITAAGETQAVPAGSQTRLPLDDDLAAAGPPSPPEPFDETRLLGLPLDLLAEEIEVPPPLTEDEIADYLASQAPVGGGLPTPGIWVVETTVVSITCEGFSQTMDMSAESRGEQGVLTVEDGGATIVVSDLEEGVIFTFERAADGAYTASLTVEGMVMAMTITVLDSETIELRQEGAQEGCTFTTMTTIVRVGDAK